ncbi:MAG: thiamine pyrophosphate-binding protein [Bacilli bacterium]|nr:thiamine pyrophosphate-binding protein [Bacilli bacterium]
MNNLYTDEKNVQIIISLLKSHNIRKVVASPGTMNVTFIGSIQNDDFFEIYSSVDERSAAYIACGLAAESREPVVITCTGATASRNYMSGLTEAYYRKLPILALTATSPLERIGNNLPQMIDRTNQLNDTFKKSIFIDFVSSIEDENNCINNVNNALLELTRHGCGPVHLNYVTFASKSFNVKKLPVIRKIERYTIEDTLPKIENKRLGIFVGTHKRMSDDLLNQIDEFCEKYNSVVLCDQTSNYTGKYGISASLIMQQDAYIAPCNIFDIIIDIGEISGSYIKFNTKSSWRISLDGEIRHRNYPIKNVFEMSESYFFRTYNKMCRGRSSMSLYKEWLKEDNNFRKIIPELPFSNAWIAQNLYNKLPTNSNLFLGILNTLRSWNYCPLLKEQIVYCNTGGFGIDGTISSLLGVSLASKNLSFCICGDLAFFYDMNSLGNRHINNKMRIMVINNGKGIEFRNYSHIASQFGEDADKYIAAGGHYGNKSITLIKNYCENLGFKYLTASNKKEFYEVISEFTNNCTYGQPILFEVFTETENESDALKQIRIIKKSLKGQIKEKLGKTLNNRTKDKLKKVIGR